MILFLLRHGDAFGAGHGDDASRELSTLGEEQARAQGRALQSCAVKPDVIIASPLVRAQQTAAIARRETGCGIMRTSEHLTPTADHRNIVQELNSLKIECVLLVGHEPHLSTLISLLITGSRMAGIEMEKGSLACVEVDGPVKYGRGKLAWLLTAAHSMAQFL